MNSRARTGLLIAIAGVFLIALGMFAAARILDLHVTSGAAPGPTPVPVAKTLVAFAANDVTAGTVLTASDVVLSEIPIEFAPRDKVTKVDDAVGRISKTDLVQGEMILEHNLANPTGVAYDVAYVLDDKHVLMALPATDLMSRESMVKRGDIVDILASYDTSIAPAAQPAPAAPTTTGQAPQQVTFTAFQRLDITAIVISILAPQNPVNTTGSALTNASNAPAAPAAPVSPGPGRDQVAVQAYLLALEPQNALVLKYLKDAGANFDLVLRAPTSSGQFQLTPVTSQYIKELYGLGLLP